MNDKNMGQKDKILKLKQLINAQQQTNKEHTSRANRLKFESEKTYALIAKAKEYKVPDKIAKPKKKEANIFAEFGTGPLSATTASQSVSSDSGFNICVCGNVEAHHKGYCINCVKKHKERFDKLIKRFTELKEEYDKYNQKDLGKADEKIKLLQNKMSQYGIEDKGLADIVSKHEKLLNSEESQQLTEWKIQIESMRSELKILSARQNMELDDMRRQQNFYET